MPDNREFKKFSECSKINQKLYDSIPRYALGETPEDLPDTEPTLYRCTTVKRGLEAAYEDTIIPGVIVDVLADLRHLCDRVKVDFADLDRVAYQHYSEEVVGERKARGKRGRK